jgi:MFS-type transporter involved in bile tolerance (Atg22 family)
MRKKLLRILTVGLVLGLIDVVPVFLADAPLFNMVAIVVFWLDGLLMGVFLGPLCAWSPAKLGVRSS